jgi:hypothetical protein
MMDEREVRALVLEVLMMDRLRPRIPVNFNYDDATQIACRANIKDVSGVVNLLTSLEIPPELDRQ